MLQEIQQKDLEHRSTTVQYLKEEIRNRILLAAKEEFLKNGYANASIRNMAESANTSLGNIYRYFTDKEAVFLAVVSPLFEDSVIMVEKNFALTKEALARYPDVILDFNEKYKDERIILCSGLRRHYQKYAAAQVEVYAEKIRSYVALTDPAALSGLKSADFFEDIAHAFMHGLYHAQNKEGAREERRQAIKELLWFFFGGLSERFSYID